MIFVDTDAILQGRVEALDAIEALQQQHGVGSGVTECTRGSFGTQLVLDVLTVRDVLCSVPSAQDTHSV